MICNECGGGYDFPTQDFSARIDDRRHARLRKICRWHPKGVARCTYGDAEIPERFRDDIVRLSAEYDAYDQAVLEAEYCAYFQLAEGSPIGAAPPPPLPDASEELLAWADKNSSNLMPDMIKALKAVYLPESLYDTLSETSALWERFK